MVQSARLNTTTQEKNVTAIQVETSYFDVHFHGRRRPVKDSLLQLAAPQLCGAMLEPNTAPHLLTCDDVERELEENDRIAPGIKWIGSIYMTPTTSAKEVLKAWERRLISHVKRYPPHGSTHSAESVSPEMLLDQNSPTGKLVSAMQEARIPLKHHGEVVTWQGQTLDPYDRERVYFQEVQSRVDETYPLLPQIFAHVSTEEAAHFMRTYGDPDRVMCELTAHHLAADRRILFDGGFILPDHHCLPAIQPEKHKIALRSLIAQRPDCVMAGSDAAGHPTISKYAAHAYGGLFTYHCALQLYIQVLDELDLLGTATTFLYGNAKRFHKDLVPDNPKRVRLVKREWTVDSRISVSGGEMTPFGYDDDPAKRFKFQWQIAS